MIILPNNSNSFWFPTPLCFPEPVNLRSHLSFTRFSKFQVEQWDHWFSFCKEKLKCQTLVNLLCGIARTPPSFSTIVEATMKVQTNVFLSINIFVGEYLMYDLCERFRTQSNSTKTSCIFFSHGNNVPQSKIAPFQKHELFRLVIPCMLLFLLFFSTILRIFSQNLSFWMSIDQQLVCFSILNVLLKSHHLRQIVALQNIEISVPKRS